MGPSPAFGVATGVSLLMAAVGVDARIAFLVSVGVFISIGVWTVARYRSRNIN